MATLLCIDDEINILELRKLLLEQQGYEVHTANCGMKGLEFFARHHVDAVLLDYRMPEMNGDEVARALRRINPNVPIILVTGFLSLEESQICDVDACVTKGQSPDVLLETIQQMLSRRMQRAAA